MSEIRSAWEIAQEKAEKLGKLSAKEQRQQKENKCNSIGKALARRFLGGLNCKGLETALDKYSDDEERKLITEAFLSHLVETIDLEHDARLEKLEEGISCLHLEQRTEALEEIEGLFQEHKRAEQRKRQEIERVIREMLHQRRISGTAIEQINIRAKPEWKESLDELAQPFNERLNEIKRGLLNSYKRHRQ